MYKNIFRKIKKGIGKIPVLILMLLFVFSNFVSYLPENIKNNTILQNLNIKTVIAATANKTFSFSIDEENYLGTSGGKSILTYDSLTGNPAGSLKTYSSGRNNNDTSNWTWTGTWEDLGVPIGSTITNIRIDSGYTYVNTWNFVDSVTIGPYKIKDNLNIDQATIWNGRTVTTGIDAGWVAIPQQIDQDIPSAIQPSNSTIKLYLEKNINLRNNTGAQATIFEDELSFTITYDLVLTPPNTSSFVNDTDGTLLDGGRSSQQISVTGTNFGAGPSDGINNAIKIGTYIIPNENFISWNDTTIVFTIPSSATTYGGVGVNGLIVRANELDAIAPLDFYIYPNITSISLNSEQIGINITVSGDHFETSAGSAIINTKPATVIGEWGETSLTVRIPGQEGVININGKIQIARNDTKTSNQFPIDPTNFTILAPSVSGSNPVSETTEQSSVSIEFSGLGIDTDIGTNPVLKLSKSGETDIIGTGYSLINPYQTISATFNLSSAVIGAWDLVIINMDGQSGTCSGCFTINPVTGPIVTGIDPVFGLTANTNITTISGSNFDSGAIVKLTKIAQPDITTSTAFTFTNTTTLSGGAFDLTTKSLGYWNVVVINSDFQTGSYDAGFEIRSSVPSDPINIYQFKNNSDTAQPPMTEITTGNGIGSQVDIYFRMDMQGGLTGELYYPQIELKTIGTPFDGTFIEGIGVMFNGALEQGWVNIVGTDNESYHWQARVRNSSGTSPWALFGGNTDPNDIDVYIDNTLPSIDTPCSNAVISTSDLSATIQWNTSDLMSGSQTPPGSGAYATSQVQYELTSSFIDWSTTPGITTIENPWGNSPHQVNLSSLSPGADYIFRMKSKDGVQNEGISGNCTFATEGARPIKTVEFFILQESNKNTGTKIKKQFDVTVPENTDITNSIQVKSAYIEISGISSATGNQTINAGLLRGDQTLQIGPVGNSYSLDSTGTTTQFTILFDILSPGSDNENINNITSGGNYNYTLFLNGDGVTDVYLFSSKLILTYNYKP